MTSRISSAGLSAARRKFTPEFINRLDKIVVFKPLGEKELDRILDLELAQVHRRVFNGTPFLFQLSKGARQHLMEEGTDPKYGARHLKRAIERSLVHPMANLIATEQIRAGDLVEVDFDPSQQAMAFERTDEGLPVYAMVRAAGIDMPEDVDSEAATALTEYAAATQARVNGGK